MTLGREELVSRIVTLLDQVTNEDALIKLLFIARVSEDAWPSASLPIRERRLALLKWARQEPGDERETLLYDALLFVTGSKAPHLSLQSAATVGAPPVAVVAPPTRINALKALAANIALRITANTSLVSGFLSGGAVQPAQRYHVGHYYFVRAIDELLEFSLRVDLLICDPLRDRVDAKYKASVSEQTKIWQKCFGGRLRVREIHIAVEKCEVGGAYQDVAMWIGERLERREDLFSQFDDALSNWKKRAEKPSAVVLEAIRTTLIEDDVDHMVDHSTAEEILSIATLLYKPPRWMMLSNDWGGKVFRFITDPSMNRILGADRIVLFEGERNRYIWDGLAYCARRFGMLADFPEREYIPSVPGIGTPDAMQSKEETMKIPLDPDWIDSHQDVPRPDLRPIIRRFDFAEDVDEYQAIKALTNEGARRLSQKYPGIPTL